MTPKSLSLRLWLPKAATVMGTGSLRGGSLHHAASGQCSCLVFASLSSLGQAWQMLPLPAHQLSHCCRTRAQTAGGDDSNSLRGFPQNVDRKPNMTIFSKDSKAHKLEKILRTPTGCLWHSRRDRQRSSGRCPRDFLMFTLEKLPEGHFQRFYVILSYVRSLLRRCVPLLSICNPCGVSWPAMQLQAARACRCGLVQVTSWAILQAAIESVVLTADFGPHLNFKLQPVLFLSLTRVESSLIKGMSNDNSTASQRVQTILSSQVWELACLGTQSKSGKLWKWPLLHPPTPKSADFLSELGSERKQSLVRKPDSPLHRCNLRVHCCTLGLHRCKTLSEDICSGTPQHVTLSALPSPLFGVSLVLTDFSGK